MDLKLVKQLLDLISESDANEVTVEEGEFKLKVKKNSDPAVPLQYQMPAYPAQQAAAPVNIPASAVQSGGSEGAKSESTTPAQGVETEGEVVKSPIVGTFYRAPSPDASPFVLTRDTVEAGQTLCMINDMKIMNEIEAEFEGTIEKVLIEDGNRVEFDQSLFIIKIVLTPLCLTKF